MGNQSKSYGTTGNDMDERSKIKDRLLTPAPGPYERGGGVLTALSLFSGIGGLEIAAHAAGIETVGFCEIEPFAVKVLERRFPGVPIVDDVRKIRGCDWSVDVIHGGFPCQDLSCAGKQEGLEGARSGLWYEMLRVIAECRPRFVLAENVRGAINLAIDTVYAGMEAEGYEVRTLLLPAAAFGAPHKRERMFVIGVRKDVADSANELLQGLWSAREQESEIHAGKIVPMRDSIGSGELWATPSVHGNYNRAGLSERSGNGLSSTVSLWPTPHRNCSNGAGAHGDGGLNIQTAVSLWSTPDANCMRGASFEERMKWKREKGLPTCHQRLRTQVLASKMWPTPSANEDACGTPDGKMQKMLGNNPEVRKTSGQLSPDWVEILMGFPIGWTDPDCDEPEPWQGWPALMGEPQFDYEPPRTCTKLPNRAARLKCLGNAVVPQQALPLFEAIAAMGGVR